jgi:hypothetical protein
MLSHYFICPGSLPKHLPRQAAPPLAGLIQDARRSYIGIIADHEYQGVGG